VAVNLAGVDHTELARGMAVVLPDQWELTSTVDVALTALEGAEFAARGAFKAYIGSGEHDVRLRVLESGGREGESTVFARLHLDTAVALEPGDRVVLRSSARQQTMGGAVVLDVSPVGRARLAPPRLVLPIGERILAGRPWLRRSHLPRLAGVSPAGADAIAKELVGAGLAAAVASGDFLVAKPVLAEARKRTVDLVKAHHAAFPLEPGLELTALAAALKLDAPRVKDALEGANNLVVEAGRVRLPGHRTSVAGEPEAKRLVAALEAAPFAPPSPAELDAPPAIVRGLVREGLLVDLDGVILAASALQAARDLVVAAMKERGSVTVADVRDVLGSSRKYVLAILARLDADGVTRRRGDDRIPGPKA
jgi:selenocysteine-specific elongation factor